MHEIKQSEERLAHALRALAQSAPQGAPPEIYTALAGAFRSHHARRRRIKAVNAAIMLALAACLVLAFGLLWKPLSAPEPPRTVRLAPQPLRAPGTTTMSADHAHSGAAASPAEVRPARVLPRAARPGTDRAGDFVALSSFDPPVASEALRIVRLRLPAADLGLVGVPVGADLSERPVVADFVVGQDGTPYAVRLVH